MCMDLTTENKDGVVPLQALLLTGISAESTAFWLPTEQLISAHLYTSAAF